MSHTTLGELEIATPLVDFVEREATPGTNVAPAAFWNALAGIVATLAPQNAALLKKRDTLQQQINAWHIRHKTHDPLAYRKFLTEIDYLVPEPADFQIGTTNVDDEIANTPGPQLVVPLDNARYVLNAANARWGSLYDALYSTDATPEADGCKKTKKYNPIRGDKVIEYARRFLDRNFPLETGTHRHATHYRIEGGELVVELGNGDKTPLLRPKDFVAFSGERNVPDAVLFKKHGLHVELRFGEGFFIGRRDHANIYDIHIESAITTIMDCEDSVSSVDTEDKLKVYRHWLELMQGTLVRTIEKDGQTLTRNLAADRIYQTANGAEYVAHGRSLMLVRNVGAHLDTDSVRYRGQPIPETFLDVMITALCAKHDLAGTGKYRNSRTGSVYIVKPKMHGHEEVALADVLFAHVEEALGLAPLTLKMGIMDEERRTSVNLKACIKAARNRLVFINTGFLDRTGDEIHTAMEAGAMLPKATMKHADWLVAYENSNVDIGLATGLSGRAQIGKGMWAMPDEMTAMMESKIRHLKAGANTAWVPSPTAATLHALHYHRFNVKTRQQELAKRSPTDVGDILAIPTLDTPLTQSAITAELENNAQGILGYVSRWVGQGIGCSKVPDINGVALMEDCATLRISSQHIANWLHHKLCTKDEVVKIMRKMARFVDRQNESDADYLPMAADFDASIPFQAALDLVFKGIDQPNGYTEFILYQRRREQKALQTVATPAATMLKSPSCAGAQSA